MSASLDRAIESLSGEAFAWLRGLVAVPSTVGHEVAAQAVVERALTAAGFKVDRQAIPESIGDDPLAGVRQRSYEGRHNILAARAGPGDGRTLLIDGHIDVVPAESPERWATPPFAPVEREGWLVGRGAGDMKCGFAASLLAIRALDLAVPGWQRGNLTFLSAIEEECTGNGTLAAIRAGAAADAVLLPEPTDLELLVGGIGILWFEIEIHGRSSHAHEADRAVNPIDVALRLIAGLRRWEDALNERPDDPVLLGVSHPYNLNIGTMRAGDWQSSVPTTATVGFRLGYPRAWTIGEAEARVREAVAVIAAGDPWLRTSQPAVHLNGFRAVGYLLPVEHPLTRAIAHAHEAAHGTIPAIVTLPSTTDARHFLNEAGIPAICYGPRTRNIHGVDEAVELQSVVDAARTIARFLLEYLGEGAA
ncbi:MAG TPA: ArgE/DapE family deacylase [Candidatus Limnocylindrales bacterium]